MTENGGHLSSAEQGLLRQVVTRGGVPGLVVAAIGERAGEAVQAILKDVAQVEGRIICVNAFPDVLDEAAAAKRDPRQITRDAILRHARKIGCRDVLTLVNGDAVELAGVFQRDTIDVLLLACRGGYEVQRSVYLAWYPAVRAAGVVLGITGAPATDAVECAPGSGAVSKNTPDPIARMVREMAPGAREFGRVWVDEKGIGGDPVAMVAAEMRRTKLDGDRLTRKHRGLLKKAVFIGQSADDREQRISMLEQLSRDFPQYLEPHLMLGGELMDLDRVEDAIRVFERPLKNKKGNAVLYGKLGVAHKARGDVAAAEAYLLASLRCDRTLLPSWLTLVMLYLERGDVARAVEGVTHALEIAPPDLESVSVLCRLSLALRNREIMARSLQLMRRLDPGHALAVALTKRLGDAGPTLRPRPRPSPRSPQPLKS